MDHEAMAGAGCWSGLARRDSDSNSFAISVDCSNDFSATFANAPPVKPDNLSII
uniref:Uncharacterized protein n=1 Tax=Rhizophora mucronata TaxID=61149 RepID=A0A2P2J4L3_RHIMU